MENQVTDQNVKKKQKNRKTETKKPMNFTHVDEKVLIRKAKVSLSLVVLKNRLDKHFSGMTWIRLNVLLLGDEQQDSQTYKHCRGQGEDQSSTRCFFGLAKAIKDIIQKWSQVRTESFCKVYQFD